MKKILQNKKLMATLTGCLGVIAANYFGVEDSTTAQVLETVIEWVTKLVE